MHATTMWLWTSNNHSVFILQTGHGGLPVTPHTPETGHLLAFKVPINDAGLQR